MEVPMQDGSSPQSTMGASPRAGSTTSSEDDCCYICLSGQEVGALAKLCKCPSRVVHRKCLARWQLQSAGQREETACRFCGADLPDWRDAMTPDGIQPASPIMSVHYNGTTHLVHVRPGPEGLTQFEADVRRVLGLGPDQDFDINFECRVPGTRRSRSEGDVTTAPDAPSATTPLPASPAASRMQLSGMSAFDAAVYCASITAAERLARARSIVDAHGRRSSATERGWGPVSHGSGAGAGGGWHGGHGHHDAFDLLAGGGGGAERAERPSAPPRLNTRSAAHHSLPVPAPPLPRDAGLLSSSHAGAPSIVHGSVGEVHGMRTSQQPGVVHQSLLQPPQMDGQRPLLPQYMGPAAATAGFWRSRSGRGASARVPSSASTSSSTSPAPSRTTPPPPLRPLTSSAAAAPSSSPLPPLQYPEAYFNPRPAPSSSLLARTLSRFSLRVPHARRSSPGCSAGERQLFQVPEFLAEAPSVSVTASPRVAPNPTPDAPSTSAPPAAAVFAAALADTQGLATGHDALAPASLFPTHTSQAPFSLHPAQMWARTTPAPSPTGAPGTGTLSRLAVPPLPLSLPRTSSFHRPGDQQQAVMGRSISGNSTDYYGSLLSQPLPPLMECPSAPQLWHANAPIAWSQPPPPAAPGMPVTARSSSSGNSSAAARRRTASAPGATLLPHGSAVLPGSMHPLPPPTPALAHASSRRRSSTGGRDPHGTTGPDAPPQFTARTSDSGSAASVLYRASSATSGARVGSDSGASYAALHAKAQSMRQLSGRRTSITGGCGVMSCNQVGSYLEDCSPPQQTITPSSHLPPQPPLTPPHSQPQLLRRPSSTSSRVPPPFPPAPPLAPQPCAAPATSPAPVASLNTQGAPAAHSAAPASAYSVFACMMAQQSAQASMLLGLDDGAVSGLGDTAASAFDTTGLQPQSTAAAAATPPPTVMQLPGQLQYMRQYSGVPGGAVANGRQVPSMSSTFSLPLTPSDHTSMHAARGDAVAPAVMANTAYSSGNAVQAAQEATVYSGQPASNLAMDSMLAAMGCAPTPHSMSHTASRLGVYHSCEGGLHTAGSSRTMRSGTLVGVQSLPVAPRMSQLPQVRSQRSGALSPSMVNVSPLPFSSKAPSEHAARLSGTIITRPPGPWSDLSSFLDHSAPRTTCHDPFASPTVALQPPTTPFSPTPSYHLQQQHSRGSPRDLSRLSRPRTPVPPVKEHVLPGSSNDEGTGITLGHVGEVDGGDVPTSRRLLALSSSKRRMCADELPAMLA